MFSTAFLSSLALLCSSSGDAIRVPADYPTIQAAVDAATSNATIQISGGPYAETVLVKNKTNLTIEGVGKPRFQGNFPGQAFLTVDGCTSVTVTGLTFANSATNGVRVLGSSSVTLSKLTIEHIPYPGLLSSAVQIDASTSVVLEKSTIRDVIADCVIDVTASSKGVTLRKNKILSCNAPGLRLRGSDHIVESNQVKGMMGDGILLDDAGCQRISISKNKISKCGNHAISLRGQEHVIEHNQIADTNAGVSMDSANASHRIRKNKFVRLKFTGVLVAGWGCTVSENFFFKVRPQGIQVVGTYHRVEKNRFVMGFNAIDLHALSSDCQVLGNTAVNLDGSGCGVFGDSHTVEGNTIRSPNDRGFWVAGKDNRVNFNTVQRSSVGFLVTGNSNALDSNKVSSARHIGFELAGSGNQVTNNKATGSKDFDLKDGNSVAVNMYTNNTFKKVSGIYSGN